MDLYGHLYENLKTTSRPFFSITGGGGKTTLMIGLARYFKKKGCSVLITTTTKVLSPYLLDYGQDKVFSDESILSYKPHSGEVVFYAHVSEDGNKWCSPGFDNLTELYGVYDIIISEADGSKRLPVKIHTARDPQIHPLTTATIAVFGMWAIGHDASEVAFGPTKAGIVDALYLDWYFEEPEGLLKDLIPNHSAVVFNGGDLGLDKRFTNMVSQIKRPNDIKIYVASARDGQLYGIY